MNSPTEEIKSRIDVVELVGSYVRLTKAGAHHKGLCPFHSEKTPSFMVSSARQMWHCFGCAKGGDIFQFIMDIEGMDFPEALKLLAERAGVVLKREDPSVRSERNRALALLEDAAQYFEKSFRDTANKPAREYMGQRGLTDESIKTFRVGYAPLEWRLLSLYLSQKGYTPQEMERSGLVMKAQPDKARKQPAYYDRFRGRIMFPIFDYQGRVIAFGGRMYPERENEAKYINSPETAHYQKSKVLYGLHAAKSSILKEGFAVVVEGYMDVLMARQAGVANVVASSGTAMGTDQMKMLHRLCDRLVVAFDMDLAGQAAADRGIQLALQNGFDLTVMDLGKYKDPADAVLADAEFFKQAVKNTRHIVQFYIDSALRTHKPDTPEGKRSCERVVLPVIAALSSELERAHWIKILSGLLSIGEDVLWRALGRAERGESAREEPTNTAGQTEVFSRKRLLEERVLGLLAGTPALAQAHGVHLDDKLFSQNYAEILLHFRSGAVLADATRSMLGRIAMESDIVLESIADREGELARTLAELRKEHTKERMAELSQAIKRAERESSPALPALLSEFQELSQKLSQK